MSLFRLVLREIAFRKLTFLVSLLAVVAAAATTVGVWSLLEGHRREVSALLAENEDFARKTMKQLGFNILVLPKNQKLHDLYAEDFASQYMPEEYVERLANSSIVTVNHLLPSLTQKVFWPEAKRTVIVVGVRDEVPIAHRDQKKPILAPVADGTAVLGYELWTALELKKGDTVRLLGREFQIGACHEQRGSKDDISLWIPLRTAQELFDKEGQINAILALECVCTAERLPRIRQEIAGILPETQVIERGTEATARAETRQQAARLAEEALAERESFAGVLIPTVLVSAALLIAVLAFLNARERRGEIGVLRALGLRARHILAVFLGKALVVGLAGAALGYPIGLWIAKRSSQGSGELFDPALLAWTLAAAPLVAVLASWLPALHASQEDPAEILRDA